VKIAVCPGSFDPVTNGHVDIFERASSMYDRLIIAVFRNPGKNPLFNMEDRVRLLKEATKHIPNVEIDSFSGLLTDFVLQKNSRIIVRGLRALSDFEYEFQRALLIKCVRPEIETVFMMTSSEYSFVSSSGIKELAQFGGDISKLVPPMLYDEITQRCRELAARKTL
jgi:pantetheine-phosphate adenylyltransferase